VNPTGLTFDAQHRQFVQHSQCHCFLKDAHLKGIMSIELKLTDFRLQLMFQSVPKRITVFVPFAFTFVFVLCAQQNNGSTSCKNQRSCVLILQIELHG